MGRFTPAERRAQTEEQAKEQAKQAQVLAMKSNVANLIMRIIELKLLQSELQSDQLKPRAQ